MATMLVLMMSAACSQAPSSTVAKNERPPMSNTVPGSYIVQAPGDGEQAIRRVFAEYGIVSLRPLGLDQFEVRITLDPGIDELKSLVNKSGGLIKSIQPNFIYRINN